MTMIWTLRQWPRAALVAGALALAGCDSVEDRVAGHYASGLALLEQGDAVKASIEFRNVLQLDDSHARARYELGKIQEAQGDLRGAVGSYRSVVELDDANADARVRLARILLGAGETEEAARLAGQAVSIAPDSADAQAVEAAVLIREEKPDEAAAAAGRALAIDPEHVGAGMVLVSRDYQRGDVAAALRRLDDVLATAPEALAPNLMKLRILEAEGRSQAMIAHLREVADRFPEDRRYRQALAQALAAEGDLEGAEAQLRALAAADATDFEAAAALVRFIRGRDGDDAARAEARRLIEAATDGDARFRLRLGLVELDYAAGERDAAREALRGLIAEADSIANRGRARLMLANYELAADDAAAASALIDAVIAEDPQNVDALAARAALAIEDDRPEAALADLRVAADAAPQNARVMLLTAQAYQRSGSLDLAGERLAAATRAAGYAPDYAIAYARFLNGREQPEAAETVLAEAVRRNEASQPLLAALAEQRLRLENWAGAAEIAERLSNLRGDDVASRQVEAAALQAQGRIEESIGVLQNLADEPGMKTVAFARLVAAHLRSGDVDKAVAMVDARLAETPGDPVALLLRAEIHLAQGERDAAEARLREIVAARPEAPTGYVSLARLYLFEGRDAEAEAVLREALGKVPAPDAPRLLLAQALERQGDFDGAIEEYARLYETQSASAVVANNLASLLAEHRGDDPEAIARATRVSQRLRNSDVPEFQDTYGWVRFLSGDPEEAVRSLAPAAEARPNNALIRYHAGMAFAALDRPAEARAHLEAALEIDPDFIRAAEARAALEGLAAGR